MTPPPSGPGADHLPLRSALGTFPEKQSVGIPGAPPHARLGNSQLASLEFFHFWDVVRAVVHFIQRGYRGRCDDAIPATKARRMSSALR